MKKSIFAIVAVLVLAITACTSNSTTETAVSTTDSTLVVADSTSVDSTLVVDTLSK